MYKVCIRHRVHSRIRTARVKHFSKISVRNVGMQKKILKHGLTSTEDLTIMFTEYRVDYPN